MNPTGLKRFKMNIYNYLVNHVHDSDPNYLGMVPFSKFHMGLFNETSPEEADILYMGQFGDSNQIDLSLYTYLDKYRDKHWADIEGGLARTGNPQRVGRD